MAAPLRLLSAALEHIPEQDAGVYTVTVRLVPATTLLVSDSDVHDGLNGVVDVRGRSFRRARWRV